MEAANNTSIHPRVVKGRTTHGKSNTCAPRGSAFGGQGGKCLRKTAKRLAQRIKVYESQSNKQGYRKPGSMQP